MLRSDGGGGALQRHRSLHALSRATPRSAGRSRSGWSRQRSCCRTARTAASPSSIHSEAITTGTRQPAASLALRFDIIAARLLRNAAWETGANATCKCAHASGSARSRLTQAGDGAECPAPLRTQSAKLPYQLPARPSRIIAKPIAQSGGFAAGSTTGWIAARTTLATTTTVVHAARDDERASGSATLQSSPDLEGISRGLARGDTVSIPAPMRWPSWRRQGVSDREVVRGRRRDGFRRSGNGSTIVSAQGPCRGLDRGPYRGAPHDP